MELPVLDLLVPTAEAGPVPVVAGEPVLRALYAVPSGGSHVRGNMISTVDGAASGGDGLSGSINGPADGRVFSVLRSLADVVLVGAGTVRAEGYADLALRPDLRAVRTGEGRTPEPGLAVVTRTGDLPEQVLTARPSPWVVTVADAPGLPRLRRVLPADRLVVHDGGVDLTATLEVLGHAGMPHVLCEGGPRLLGAMLAGGLVDELCLTTSPLVTAGTAGRVVGAPTQLDPPLTGTLETLLHGDGMLMARWRLTATAP
ncbi:dihydrofolate reductase family protein [Cellulomonas bogoriensis]|uniref:Deaminase n=1 Tax=Cellulomonas bogoriensis 69B4 = DSM 16987 TaxID=1386082 RepID=A0A0A0BZ84_9CELL|nr:dihydrofolate reductase family protein [Cellulomonas bogoriensis]KGM13216.1 deaminase [Cellulomonas bogoriensis 69B4 = DSM 16987]